MAGKKGDATELGQVGSQNGTQRVRTADVDLLAEGNEEPELTPVSSGTEPSALVDSDDWQLADLRLSQDFGAEFGGKRVITTVEVRKPNRQEFFRIHPDPHWRLETLLLFLEGEGRGETYIVSEALRDSLEVDLVRVELLTAIDRAGTPFLWPLRLPRGTRKPSAWYTSAVEAARLAQRFWIRMVADQGAQSYAVYQATGNIPEPQWREDITFEGLVRLAFKGQYIKTYDHPVLHQLRGGS